MSLRHSRRVHAEPAPIITMNIADPFRAFEAYDFLTYQGVETERPLIAELAWGVVLIDGSHVELIRNDEKLTSFTRVMRDADDARIVGYALATEARPCDEQVELWLYRV
jgi:hypothetical protein